jgi:hypothetical protein
MARYQDLALQRWKRADCRIIAEARLKPWQLRKWLNCAGLTEFFVGVGCAFQPTLSSFTGLAAPSFIPWIAASSRPDTLINE